MSFEDWLYKKAEQNAHNEILAFLMMILGMNMLVGGLVVSIIAVGQPLFLPFIGTSSLSPPSMIGVLLTFGGFLILCAGFVLVIYYDRKRTWHMGEIDKSARLRERKIKIKKANELLKELSQEEAES